jgi:hypothetical protein
MPTDLSFAVSGMAEVIHIRDILQARRRQREQQDLRRCIELIEASLKVHIAEFESASIEEWQGRAEKIRKLGELLEYATNRL